MIRSINEKSYFSFQELTKRDWIAVVSTVAAVATSIILVSIGAALFKSSGALGIGLEAGGGALFIGGVVTAVLYFYQTRKRKESYSGPISEEPAVQQIPKKTFEDELLEWKKAQFEAIEKMNVAAAGYTHEELKKDIETTIKNMGYDSEEKQINLMARLNRMKEALAYHLGLKQKSSHYNAVSIPDHFKNGGYVGTGLQILAHTHICDYLLYRPVEEKKENIQATLRECVNLLREEKKPPLDQGDFMKKI